MPPSPPRVLLADDTRFFRQAIAEMLEESGWSVLQAADGRAALEAALRELPDLDLVILDVEMPEMDGIQVLEGLRGHADGARVPVLILSGKALSEEHRERVMSLGIVQALEKSAPLPELAQQIRQAVGGEAGASPRRSR